MSDRESPEGGPPRKKLATSHTPEEGTSGAQGLGVDLLQEALNEAFDDGQQPSGSSTVTTEDPNALPADVVNYYALRSNQIEGIDENDMKVLFSHNPRYLIEQTLGSGSYGSVHWAHVFHQDQDRLEAAIKILKKGVGNANAYTIPLERNIVERLMPHPHENVVFFNEMFYTTEMSGHIWALYMVSELSTVGDLFHAVQTRNPQGVSVWVPIKEGVARLLIKGIANGVQHLKTLHICHGDLKLENILLFDRPAEYPINDELDRTRIDRWIPKLTDFGASKSRKEYDLPGKIIVDYPTCSLAYASPESWLKNPDGSDNIFDGYSADVFSVGVCLISLLIGANPFQHGYKDSPEPNDPEYDRKWRRYVIYSNGIKKDISYLQHLCKIFSHPLRQLLLKSLEPNPEQRITVEQFLTDPWITTRKPYELENIASPPASGYYGISPTLRTFGGKGYAKDI